LEAGRERWLHYLKFGGKMGIINERRNSQFFSLTEGD